MQIKSSVQTAPSIEPLQKTWEIKQDAGTWGITPSFDFTSLSTQQVNNWYVNVTLKTINAFSKLCRVWGISFSSHYSEKIKPVMLKWQPGSSYHEYIEKVVKAIGEYPGSIEILEMYVDMLVFVHTEESPDKPVRNWVESLGEFVIRGGKKYGEPYLYLEMEHTLFCPYSYEGDDNKKLFNLNQPLLEEALRNWEKKFDVEIDFEGLPGIYKYGFLPEAQW